MGSEKFRFSDMMVSSWFNNLKDMRRADGRRSMSHDDANKATLRLQFSPPEQQKQQGEYLLPNRASYYYSSRERTVKLPRSPVDTKAWNPIFPAESPRTSDQRPRRGHPKASARQASPAGRYICNCHSSSGSVRKYGGVPESSACVDCSSSVSSVFEKLEGFEAMSGFKLRPILTRPSKKEVHDKELSCTETRRTTPRRRLMRIKVRPRYPRTTAKRSQISCRVEAAVPSFAVQQQQPKAISDSLIVVVLSLDPHRDFKESMLEMIVANEITRPKDLEELLACYLSLNSEEHHETIIRVFKQIWFDLMLI